MEKRKREDDGGSNGRQAEALDDDGGGASMPADEEVEEFFAILKRIQVAVKYFQERRDRRCAESEMTAAAASRWIPTFEREDFDGVKMERNRSVDLDLNSDPASDVSDCAD